MAALGAASEDFLGLRGRGGGGGDCPGQLRAQEQRGERIALPLLFPKASLPRSLIHVPVAPKLRPPPEENVTYCSLVVFCQLRVVPSGLE